MFQQIPSWKKPGAFQTPGLKVGRRDCHGLVVWKLAEEAKEKFPGGKFKNRTKAGEKIRAMRIHFAMKFRY